MAAVKIQKNNEIRSISESDFSFYAQRGWTAYKKENQKEERVETKDESRPHKKGKIKYGE